MNNKQITLNSTTQDNSNSTPQKDNSNSTPQKGNSNSTPQKDNSNSIPQKDNSNSIPQKDNSNSTPQKDNSRRRDTSYHHVLKYIGVLGGVHGLKMLVSLVRNKLASMILHKEGVGVGAVYGNISELLYNSTNMGLSFSALRNLSEFFENGTYEQQSQTVRVIRTWALLTAIVAALLCLGMSSLLCRWYFDGDTDYLLPVCLLSAYIFTLPLEAVECSIVKGMRRLKSLAMIESTVVIGTFLLTIPLYYLLGISGIVLALVLSGYFTLAVHFVVTLKMFPLRVNPFDTNVLRQGLPLLRLGIPYVLAGIAGALSVSFVYNILEDMDEVGLFRQGYLVLTMSSGMVFTAMDSDYFPRLSSANHDVSRMNSMANQQIHANVLLITPLLILMALLMPHLIRLISSNEFIPVAPMVVFGVFHLLFQAAARPISYYPLAKGNTLMFLFMELLYDAIYVCLVYFGYEWGNSMHLYFDNVDSGGLIGTGVALSLANLLELFIVSLVYGKCFGFRYEHKTIMLIFGEFLCLLVVVPFCLRGGIQLLKYSVGFTSLCVSIYLAWRLLSHESNLFRKSLHKVLHHGDGGCC